MSTSDMEAEVRKAMAQGRRVQEAVRDITLQALSRGGLDAAAVRKATGDVIGAIRAASAEAGASARETGAQAMQGVGQALAHAAQALRLTLEEAAGRAGQFSREDLARTRAMLEDLAKHAQASGAAVARELAEARLPERAAAAGRAQFEAGAKAAAASGEMLARVAAGVLAGIADALAGKPKG
jgi:hypothetical protein